MFLYDVSNQTVAEHNLYIYIYYLCVVHNNLIVKYQLCLNKLFSVSVSVSVIMLYDNFMNTYQILDDDTILPSHQHYRQLAVTIQSYYVSHLSTMTEVTTYDCDLTELNTPNSITCV